MIRISQILKSKGDRVVTIAPDTTIAEVVDVLKRERIGAVVKNRLEELETETAMLQEYITGRS